MSNVNAPVPKWFRKNQAKTSVLNSDNRPDDTKISENIRVVDKRWWARSNKENKEKVPSNKPTYIEELEKRVADKDEELKKLSAKHKQNSKEFENVRIRMKREVEKDAEKKSRSVLIAFLEVVDNLDRALESNNNQSTDKTLTQGIELVRRQCLKTLKTHGVFAMDTTGIAFDPNFHDAVSVIPISETKKDNIVIETVKTGYLVGTQVLRPASVTVGKLQ